MAIWNLTPEERAALSVDRPGKLYLCATYAPMMIDMRAFLAQHQIETHLLGGQDLSRTPIVVRLELPDGDSETEYRYANELAEFLRQWWQLDFYVTLSGTSDPDHPHFHYTITIWKKLGQPAEARDYAGFFHEFFTASAEEKHHKARLITAKNSYARTFSGINPPAL